MVNKGSDSRKAEGCLDRPRIKTSVGLRDRVVVLVGELGIVFENKATLQSVRILNGSRGTYPKATDAVEMLYGLWKGLSPEMKAKLMSDFTDAYIAEIKKNRPEAMITLEVDHAK